VVVGTGIKPIEVLMIEDNPADFLLTQRLLEKAGDMQFHINSANRLSRGIDRAAEGEIDIILLDLDLPDGHGLDTFLRLKSHLPRIPIVVLSGIADEEISRQAVLEGAQDYLNKGQTDSVLLEHSIRYSIERQKAEDRIRILAYHDPLTGLPNRRLLIDRGLLSLAESKRYNNKTALMLLYLDNFKDINDRLGHEAGDEVLKELAGRLINSLRLTDTVCRLGGDEFAILISEMNGTEAVTVVADKLLEAVRKPLAIGGRITVSLGIAFYPDDGEDLQTLLKAADLAMYEAKKSGGDSYRLNFSNKRRPADSYTASFGST
jgi:diguanylate cyclase (GGDEF)-like protein